MNEYPEDVDNKVLFKSLPIVGEEFNYVSIDILLIDIEEELYTPLIRYMIVDDNSNIQAGFTLQTGISANGYDNIVREVGRLVKTGLFDLQEICGTGTLYNQETKRTADIDWNDEVTRISFADEDNHPPIKFFH